MAISIQVKNSYDAQASNYSFGVTPIDQARTSSMNGIGWCDAPSIHNATDSGFAWNAPAFGQDAAFVQPLAHQASMRSAHLSAIVAQVAAIDTWLAGRISAIGATCTGTAIKIGQVSMIDKALAVELTRIAEFDLATAVSLATVAVVNPIAARTNLQRGYGSGVKGRKVADQGLRNAVVHDDGTVYRIEAFLPGLVAEDIDVSARNGRLMIKALCSEFGGNGDSSACTKAFTLGNDVSIEDIDATVANGRLTVLIPRINVMVDANRNPQVCRATATV